MKRLILASLLVCAYIWSTATGRDQFVLDQGKRLYQVLCTWFDDAEIDFQIDNKTPPAPAAKKKRPRRWD